MAKFRHPSKLAGLFAGVLTFSTSGLKTAVNPLAVTSVVVRLRCLFRSAFRGVLEMTELGLFGRVKRALLKREHVLLRKCSHRSRFYYDVGDYYTVDMSTNCVLAKHVDLDDLAAELGIAK